MALRPLCRPRCLFNAEISMGLPIEFLRIGITTLLYLACIWGWGALLCRRLLEPEDGLPDFVGGRLVMGCLVLYAGFILLAWIGHLRPIPVAAVYGMGLLLTLLDLPAVIAKIRTAWDWISRLEVNERAMLG